jgi:hypothetical protein
MSIEILDENQKEKVLEFLSGKQLPPTGVHYVRN